MSTESGTRRYNSSGRRARAAATRQAILDAAETEFGRRGYVSTSITQVARTAGVAPETVYASFRTKLGVLGALIGRAVGGDAEPIALLDRAWVAEMTSEPSRDRRIMRLAHEGAAVLARRAGIDEVVSQAAGADAEAAALLEAGRRERWAGQRRLLEIVIGPDTSRDVSPSLDQAADVLFAIGSPEVYQLLVAGRGWTHADFESWYAAAIEWLIVGLEVPLRSGSGASDQT
jgi:AcrR family transcriptional regulator